MNRALRVSRSLAAALLIASLASVAVGGCGGPIRALLAGPLRISEITQAGDPRRQASTRLVVEGLDAEIASSRERAIGRYERAIQIDPGNPFAYLALARYYADAADPQRALEHLDRAQSFLDFEDPLFRRTEPHLRGLRGWSLAETERSADAERLLADARRLAPAVWADGRLEASELR